MLEFQPSKEIKKRKIKSSLKKEIEPQEILLDSLAKKRERELGFPERKIEEPLPSKSLFLILFFGFFLIIILFARVFQLQIIEAEKYLLLSQKNKYILKKIKTARGIIYDRNFEQLVFNQPVFNLVLEKNNLPEKEKEKILKSVSQIIKRDINILKKEMEEDFSSNLIIKENLSLDEIIIFESKKEELPGFKIEKNFTRLYSEGPIFSHVIGYFRKTGEKSGLEESYDTILKEKPGEVLIKRDVYGNPLSQETLRYPQSGNSLVLWLDSKLQKKITEELTKRMQEVNAKAAVGIALDVESGGVLALVSLPSFDNNFFSKTISEKEWKLISENPQKPLFNWAISGSYLTGSIIKPLIALAGLKEGLISPQKEILCQGEIFISSPWEPNKKWRFADWKVHGQTNLKKAIAESCNIYFYHLGEKLGPSKINHYLSLFGWGKKVGIDIKGEEEGFLPTPEWKKEKLKESWYDGDTYHFSIGQGYLRITPLQVATSFLALANGGKILTPKLVQKIINEEKNLVEEIRPEIIRENFIEKENLKIVLEGMRQTVTAGTASGWLDHLPIPVAAKTGSAQTGKKGLLDAWIVIITPYEKPKMVLVLMIKEAKEGEPIVLPVAKSILEWYFSQYEK